MDLYISLQLLHITQCKLDKIEMTGVELVNERTALWLLGCAALHHSTTLQEFTVL